MDFFQGIKKSCGIKDSISLSAQQQQKDTSTKKLQMSDKQGQLWHLPMLKKHMQIERPHARTSLGGDKRSEF